MSHKIPYPKYAGKAHETFETESKSVEKKLHNYRKYNINVGKETHNELIELVAHIYRTSKKELEDVFTEADKAGRRVML